MFEAFQILSVLCVSVAMALSVAHALELPGKLRLDPATYTTVQSIYYPGFTIGGMVGEAGGMLVTLALLLLTPVHHATFGWTLAALILLVIEHVCYWLFTHPVNRFWLRDQKLQGVGAGFFGFDPLNRRDDAGSRSDPEHWRRSRSRWEYSHVVRAVLAGASLIVLVTGVALEGA